MAAESRNSSSALTVQTTTSDERPEFANLRKLLEEEPFRVHFFQAVRMLQKMARTQAGGIFRLAAG